MPAVFLIQTNIQKPSGGQFMAPFRVPDDSLEAFVERLAEDGVAVVEQLNLTDADRNGDRWIMEARKLALGLSAILTIQPMRNAVRERPLPKAA